MTDLNYLLTHQQTDPNSGAVSITPNLLLMDPVTELVHVNFDYTVIGDPDAPEAPEASTLCGEQLDPDTARYLVTARVTCADCGEILVKRGLAVKMDADDARELDAQIHADVVSRTVTNRGIRRAEEKRARRKAK